MGVQNELHLLTPSALLELYELDATEQGGDVMYFHAGTNELGQDVIWQGITYVRLPIESGGFEQRSSGALPRPTVRISNVEGLIAADARAHGYFLGARFTRRRTFARFLDAANFPNGNPSADPTQSLPDEIWIVDRKSVENSTMIEFELASGLDIMGLRLPRRQIIQNSCTWEYRKEGCGYVGLPVADAANNPTSDPSKDRCSKTLTGCKLRFNVTRMPFGGFPSVGLLR